MRKLGLDRETLAKIAPNPQALRELERVFNDVSLMPSTIEEAAAQANQAIAAAASLLSVAQELAQMVEMLSTAPAIPDMQEPDDTDPRVQLGTISSQDADYVDIDGGFIDGTEIGKDTPTKAAFTTVEASDQITSTVADGTPPLVVDSMTLVENLYVARAVLADTATLALTANYATTAGELDNPTTFPPNATDLSSVITLANALRAAAIDKGL